VHVYDRDQYVASYFQGQTRPLSLNFPVDAVYTIHLAPPGLSDDYRPVTLAAVMARLGEKRFFDHVEDAFTAEKPLLERNSDSVPFKRSEYNFIVEIDGVAKTKFGYGPREVHLKFWSPNHREWIRPTERTPPDHQ